LAVGLTAIAVAVRLWTSRRPATLAAAVERAV
jgi:hypothetical protein